MSHSTHTEKEEKMKMKIMFQIKEEKLITSDIVFIHCTIIYAVKRVMFIEAQLQEYVGSA